MAKFQAGKVCNLITQLLNLIHISFYLDFNLCNLSLTVLHSRSDSNSNHKNKALTLCFCGRYYYQTENEKL